MIRAGVLGKLDMHRLVLTREQRMGWGTNYRNGFRRGGGNYGKPLGTGNIPEELNCTWGRGNAVDQIGVLGQGGQ